MHIESGNYQSMFETERPFWIVAYSVLWLLIGASIGYFMTNLFVLGVEDWLLGRITIAAGMFSMGAYNAARVHILRQRDVLIGLLPVWGLVIALAVAYL